jgi:hypothetical protein
VNDLPRKSCGLYPESGEMRSRLTPLALRASPRERYSELYIFINTLLSCGCTVQPSRLGCEWSFVFHVLNV